MESYSFAFNCYKTLTLETPSLNFKRTLKKKHKSLDTKRVLDAC